MSWWEARRSRENDGEKKKDPRSTRSEREREERREQREKNQKDRAGRQRGSGVHKSYINVLVYRSGYNLVSIDVRIRLGSCCGRGIVVYRAP